MTPILAAALLAVLASPGPRGIPYEDVAKAYLASHGLEGKSPHDVSFDEVLATGYASIRLGAFEVYFPVEDLEKRSGDLKDCALALLGAQERMLEWTKPLGSDQKAMRADLKALSGWVKGIRTAALAKCRDCPGKDLTEALGATDALREASDRLAEHLGRGEALGVTASTPVRLRLLLAPTRRSFAEIACFVGWWSEEWRPTYWTDAMADWSTCWVDDVQVIALEVPSAGRAAGDYTSGSHMNERDPDGMQQQVVQLSVQRAFERFYGEQVPSAFLGGLAMNLVIDQFGEINTRVDGDLRARATQRREVFVPGGASNGGFLPKSSAESRWREDRGKDRFVRVLRQAQKEGQGLDKTLENRAAGFGIRADDGGEVHPVHAPFLGPGASSVAPPEKFSGDFAELIRAYKCAFIAWLQTKATGQERLSREAFAMLLKRLASNEVAFEDAFREVYGGTSLSDEEAGKDSLEGEFLIWLSKQR